MEESTAKIAEHEKSELHKESVMKLAAKSTTPNVGAQLIRQHDADMRNHRSMFLKLLECV